MCLKSLFCTEMSHCVGVYVAKAPHALLLLLCWAINGITHTHTFIRWPALQPPLLLIHPPSTTHTHIQYNTRKCITSHLQMEEISSALPVSAADVRCGDGTLTIGPMTAVRIGRAEQSPQPLFNSMRIVWGEQWPRGPQRVGRGWERWVCQWTAADVFVF